MYIGAPPPTVTPPHLSEPDVACQISTGNSDDVMPIGDTRRDATGALRGACLTDFLSFC